TLGTTKIDAEERLAHLARDRMILQSLLAIAEEVAGKLIVGPARPGQQHFAGKAVPGLVPRQNVSQIADELRITSRRWRHQPTAEDLRHVTRHFTVGQQTVDQPRTLAGAFSARKAPVSAGVGIRPARASVVRRQNSASSASGAGR